MTQLLDELSVYPRNLQSQPRLMAILALSCDSTILTLLESMASGTFFLYHPLVIGPLVPGVRFVTATGRMTVRLVVLMLNGHLVISVDVGVNLLPTSPLEAVIHLPTAHGGALPAHSRGWRGDGKAVTDSTVCPIILSEHRGQSYACQTFVQNHVTSITVCTERKASVNTSASYSSASKWLRKRRETTASQWKDRISGTDAVWVYSTCLLSFSEVWHTSSSSPLNPNFFAASLQDWVSSSGYLMLQNVNYVQYSLKNTVWLYLSVCIYYITCHSLAPCCIAWERPRASQVLIELQTAAENQPADLHTWRLWVPTNNYTTSPTHTNNYATNPTHTNNYTTSPTRRNNYATNPTHTNNYTTSPTHTNNYATNPTHTNNYTTSPTHTNNYATNPTHTNNYTPSPTHKNNSIPVRHTRTSTLPVRHTQTTTLPVRHTGTTLSQLDTHEHSCSQFDTHKHLCSQSNTQQQLYPSPRHKQLRSQSDTTKYTT